MVIENLYGLALCGGKSSRMGTDKSLLNYHGIPQCYYVYELLSRICEAAFISCNSSQLSIINKKYKAIEDNVFSRDLGPLSGILTACNKFPGKDLLVIGGDYPFLNDDEIGMFLSAIDRSQPAAAFYDEVHQVYQPVLAWYSSAILGQIFSIIAQPAETFSSLTAPDFSRSISLQKILKSVNAGKYIPQNRLSMFSADTKEEADDVFAKLNQVLIKK